MVQKASDYSLKLKKTANKKVFEDISTELEKIMTGEDFMEENRRERRLSKSHKELLPLNIEVERLRIKFKWMKDQWRKYTDRVKKGSGKSPIQEPEWYTIINPVFCDINGNLEISSKAVDVLSDDSDSEVSYNENTKSADMDEGHDTDESDLAKASDSGTDCNKKIKKKNWM